VVIGHPITPLHRVGSKPANHPLAVGLVPGWLV